MAFAESGPEIILVFQLCQLPPRFQLYKQVYLWLLEPSVCFLHI